MLKFFLLLLAFTQLPLVGAQTVRQAKTFLEDIYSWDTNSEADDPLGDSNTYAPTLVTLMRRDQRLAGRGNVGKLDFDPLCSCQDPGGAEMKIVGLNKTGSQSTQAHIAVTFPDRSETSLRLDLVWTKAGWRIADIHTKKVQSLRKFLHTR